MTRETFLCSLALALAIVQPSPGHGAPKRPKPVQIDPGPLSQGLSQLTRQTQIELLYDRQIVRGIRSSAVRGTMHPEGALKRLLSGTAVGYRRTAEGVYILFLRQRPAEEVAEQEPIPEILVVGRRTQNADIRRTRNDIQPYFVSTGTEIENAHAGNVNQFMRSRISPNAQFFDPAQDAAFIPAYDPTRINLRGLGTLRTLVLIDGRRMPRTPTPQFDFGQADVNAFPISAIERIETLTGTAGGIYGSGAIGGVVNIVLRRNYRGADIRFTSGLTSRGDARRIGIDARFGFTPNDGRTEVMLFASRTKVDPLLTGQRDFVVRARRHRFANDPAGYVADPPTTDVIQIFSQNGDLTLDPELGGAALGSPYTFIPTGLGGSSADRIGLLRANAGNIRFDLSPDETGARKFLLSSPKATAGILNVRHEFNGRLEAFVDAFYYRNDGRFEGPFEGPAEPLPVVTAADAPNNPFQQDVIFRFPISSLTTHVDVAADWWRATAGIVASLGGGWKGNADLTLGQVKTWLRNNSLAESTGWVAALRDGILDAGGQPVADPLGDWSSLAAAAAAHLERTQGERNSLRRLLIGSFRLAGPLVRLPGGPLSLSLLAERRRDHSPAGHVTLSAPFEIDFPIPSRAQNTTSGYLEMRAPVLAEGTAVPVLRDLELQLAARYDHVRTVIPTNQSPAIPTDDQLATLDQLSITHNGATFTAGARFFPLRLLMLRGSVATGRLLPTMGQLVTTETIFGSDQFGVPDPLRGNRLLGSEGDVVLRDQGSHELKPERATTISIGAVLNPKSRAWWPRVSADYSRVDIRDQISPFTTDTLKLLANENDFPGRVVRAPLTDEDRALGFTAGRVLNIDKRAVNGARTLIETIDVQLDWTLPLRMPGELRLYGNASWYLTFKKKPGPHAPWVSRVGFSNGPLAWRGNIGIEWTRGPMLIGLNAQCYDSYRATQAGDQFAAQNDRILKFQGSSRIGSQTYVDLVVRRRFDLNGAGPLKSFDANFGIQNLFDRRPPLVADPSAPGFSAYGDPRRRRFELLLTASF